ncbi:MULTISPECIES: OsmC family protein [unclassified Mycolicibacterium]|uniref:OsmC family protein n=1 Tax=unclassified Mycolicibacterium TaxID=2636767 RepID=UPI0012DC5110|nr:MULTISPECIES: OsmC family protein [unclassified Mycolicibacterium]MUL85660.1 OsmC family protein [Mycolicibacterium sp. CBMA 329]MUL91537.1 OsmC family protein [Mycolicibacterium sp. CBMA 331]MUM02223.1 OsmC family protein [Mycolicibacterium sp. CBMA 334]MUM27318.1 OsmC family protein [Mycolicibacterium sp. CBMA 295]MUM41173.1 OsmC family protein [Mycolicibacterium sp. CBMA 247]
MTQTINGVDVGALKDTAEAVKGNRTLGKVSFSLNGQWQDGFRVNSETGPLTQGGQIDSARAGKYALSSDEPSSLLGSDTAVSPAEYVLQALAGCYTVTLAANAAERGIELQSYRLELEADFDLGKFLGVALDEPAGASQVRVNVHLEAPGVDRKALEDLVATVQQRSPIRDTLARAVEVRTTLK